MLVLIVLGCLFFCGAAALFVMLVLERVRYFDSGARVHVYNQMLYLLGTVVALLLGVGVMGYGVSLRKDVTT